MPDTSDLLAAGIDPAGAPAPGAWVPPTPEALAGALPQLEILALIGQGGMGAVYKARQTHLDRLVAVKLLSAERGADPAFVERFTREGRALARLQHPQIITLYDFGRAGSWLYLVMEHVDGANLRQLMATGRLDPAAALRLVAPLCDALVHAHAQGVIHRDLKPENILIDVHGQPKIADFGLAKLRSANGDLTQTGDTLGTLHYMSPEQVSGTGDIDHRADVYALGVILYEMLTGNLPLGRCAPPSQSGSDPRLDEVVLKSLEREPAKRWQSVEELRQAVAKVQARMPAAAPLPTTGQRSWKAGAAWGLVVAATIGVLAFVFSRPGQPIVRSVPQAAPLQADLRMAEARLDEAVKEAKRIETLLASMELRRAESERKIKDLNAQMAHAEADATKAAVDLDSVRQQQAQVTTEVERLIRQRQDHTQELEVAMKTIQTKKDEAARSQERADTLAKELAGRLPGPAPAAPARLEVRYDRDAMTTIGQVIRSDGSSQDLEPVPWPREGAKVMVSAAKEVVERRFTDLVIAHHRAAIQRQRLIGELVVEADELARLDVDGRHTALIAQLKRLGDEKP
jgi:hypothetical protein